MVRHQHVDLYRLNKWATFDKNEAIIFCKLYRWLKIHHQSSLNFMHYVFIIIYYMNSEHERSRAAA